MCENKRTEAESLDIYFKIGTQQELKDFFPRIFNLSRKDFVFWNIEGGKKVKWKMRRRKEEKERK